MPGRDNQDWRTLFPFAEHFLSLPSGHRMHYVDECQGPGHETLLCIHGNPTWSFYYRSIISAFRNSFRVIAPDHVGCGFSDKPGSDYPYTLTTHVENLVQLIQQLDLRSVTLVVHDWGGAIGMGAAQQVPDRIRRLVFFNTATFPPPYFPWRIRVCRFPLLGQWALQGGNLFARAAVRMATNQPGGLPKSVARGLLAPYDTWRNRHAIYRFVKDIPTRRTQPTWQKLVEIERGVPVFSDRPALLVWGMDDWCFRPECMERIQNLLPDAESLPLDAGHYVLEDAADTIVRRLHQFFSETQ